MGCVAKFLYNNIGELQAIGVKSNANSSLAEGQRAALVLTGTFQSLEICNAAFDQGVLCENVSVIGGRLVVAAQDCKLLFESLIVNLSGVSIHGTITNISSVKRGKDIKCEWVVSIISLKRKRADCELQCETLRIILQGFDFLRYRYLLRIGNQIKMTGVKKVKFDELGIHAYLASPEFSCLKEWNGSEDTEHKISLRVDSIEKGVIFAKTADSQQRPFMVELSKWGRFQLDVINIGSIISIYNITRRSFALILCCHSHLIVESLGTDPNLLPFFKLSDTQLCAIHRLNRACFEIKGLKSNSTLCMNGRDMLTPITDCCCHELLCSEDIALPIKMICSLPDSTELELYAKIKGPNLVYDDSFPDGLSLCVPPWVDVDRLSIDDQVIGESIRLRGVIRSRFFLIQYKTSPLYDSIDRTSAVIISTDSEKCSARCMSLLDSKSFQVNDISPQVFGALAPMDYVRINERNQLKRSGRPFMENKRYWHGLLKASASVVICHSISDALMHPPFCNMILKHVFVNMIRIPENEELTAIPSRFGLSDKVIKFECFDKVQKMNVYANAASILNPSQIHQLNFKQQRSLHKADLSDYFPLPSLCDFHEVSLVIDVHETFAVVLPRGRVVMRFPRIPPSVWTPDKIKEYGTITDVIRAVISRTKNNQINFMIVIRLAPESLRPDSLYCGTDELVFRSILMKGGICVPEEIRGTEHAIDLSKINVPMRRIMLTVDLEEINGYKRVIGFSEDRSAMNWLKRKLQQTIS